MGWFQKKPKPEPPKRQYRDETFCEIIIRSNRGLLAGKLYVTSDEAKRIKATTTSFVDGVQLFEDIYGLRSDHFPNYDKFYGYAKGHKYDFNLNEITGFGQEFESQELLNFDEVKESLGYR